VAGAGACGGLPAAVQPPFEPGGSAVRLCSEYLAAGEGVLDAPAALQERGEAEGRWPWPCRGSGNRWVKGWCKVYAWAVTFRFASDVAGRRQLGASRILLHPLWANLVQT
jgi:hypothetical protein